MRSAVTLTLLSIVLLAAPAMGQVSALPADVAAAFAANGPAVSLEVLKTTAAALTPLQPSSRPADVREALDLPYGSANLEVLDVYAPNDPTSVSGSPRPVLIFVPGGGFVSAEKRRAGTFVFQNVGYMGVHDGLVVVIPSYRVVPKDPYPAGAEDIAAVIRWVRGNIAAYGGDPARITLMGHSGGASHVADYIGQPRFYPEGEVGVRGVILASGIYDPASSPPLPGLVQYYGADRQLQAERAAKPGLVASRLPMLLAIAGLDPPRLFDQAEALHAALCARGDGCPRLLRLSGHNHLSEVFALGTADREFEDAIVGFVRDPG